jgi:aminopeptidase N
MRKFLKYELDDYLKKRGGELVEELPLFRVENQPYIHYQKGSLAFYRLRDEIGEDHLNRALSKYLKEKGFQQPPYTTSRELLADIREETPPDRQQFVTDLFEKIVFYDNRAEAATARKRPDGKYEVSLEYLATKLQADGQGVEKEVPLDDWIDVGVFARPKGAKESKETVLALHREHIVAGKGTIRFVVDSEPYDVGIDPYNKLIDRVPTDNRKQVTLQ